jgi:5-methylcytosine-specific restriction protein A
MPSITRLKDLRKKRRYRVQDKGYVHKGWAENGNENHRYYNKQWSDLRLSYLLDHPLCECCQRHGYVRAAEQVHHKAIILSGDTDEERQALTLNPKNLMSLCVKCHRAMHRRARASKLKYIDALSVTEYNNAHGIVKEKENDTDAEATQAS